MARAGGARTLRWRFAAAVLGTGAALSLGTVACFSSPTDTDGAATGRSRVTEQAANAAALLKSTLVLESGCTAVKVGPKHVLLAARCVTGTGTGAGALAAGKPLRYVAATVERAPATAARPTEANRFREATIAAVHVHESFTTRCREDSCALGSLVASDAADVAVLELAAALDSVPSVPVDLDPVGTADPLIVVGSQCETLDGTPGDVTATRSIAVPADSAVHVGSPYESSPQLTSRLASSYLLTAGPGWRDESPGFCRSDIGGPVFRAGAAAVAGVHASFTTWGRNRSVPVTLHHTRLDSRSRENIGSWLTELGVETIHTCSESIGGCARRPYDGGAPTPPVTAESGGETSIEDGDAGLDGGGILERPAPKESRLEPEAPRDDDYDMGGGYTDEEEDTDAGGKAKKAPAAGGCSTTPGTAPVGGGLGLALAATFVALGARRRRRA